MVYNIHILQTRKTGRVVAAAAASVLCCMGAVFPATIGVTAASADEPVELVVNGGFEDDLNGWKSGTVWNSSASSIAVTADDVHGGSGALSVTDRASSDAGAIQSLDGKVEKGQTYTGSMWVKATEDGEFNITVCSGNGSGCDQIATGTAKAGEWTQISGTGTLGGSGDFTSPSLVIENKYGTSNADFIVDDISVTGSDSGSSFVPPTTGTATAAKAFGDYSNPIIDYWYGADPWAMEYNGRVYIYTTGDGTSVNADGSLNYDYEYDSTGQIKDNSFAQVKTINVLSSDDMVNWRNEGYIRVAGEQGVATWASNSWAPAVAHKTINGKEKFFLYFANGGSGIGVLTSDSPVGPWKDETGELLIKGGTPESAGVVWLFDPAVFVDDDGQGYLYYGGGVPTGEEEHPNTARVIKLSDDMLHTEGEAQAIDAPAMFEDSGIAKIGGTYYYSYCTNFSHDNVIDGNTVGYGNIAYMTSDNPMGPFTYQGEILKNPSTYFGVGGNNHHAMVQLGDQWYMTYHAQTVAKELMNGGNLDAAHGYRNTHLDPITVNEDGSIADIAMTYEGLSSVKNLDAYQDGGIPASTIAWDSGIQNAYDLTSGVRVVDMTTDNSEGQKLSNINNGEWTSLANVDFGNNGASSLTVTAAGKAGGILEIRLDDPDSEPVASISIPAGDGSEYADYTTTLEGVTGVHHVVFSFKSDGGANAQDELYDITTYTFTESQDETPSTPVDKSDLQSAVNENSGLNASDYTEESWKVFADALQKAQAVLQDESATEQQVQDALAALNSARAGLKLADDSTDGNASDAVDDTDGVDLAQTGSSVLPGAVIVACLALTGVIVARVRREMR